MRRFMLLLVVLAALPIRGGAAGLEGIYKLDFFRAHLENQGMFHYVAYNDDPHPDWAIAVIQITYDPAISCTADSPPAGWTVELMPAAPGETEAVAFWITEDPHYMIKPKEKLGGFNLHCKPFKRGEVPYILSCWELANNTACKPKLGLISGPGTSEGWH